MNYNHTSIDQQIYYVTTLYWNYLCISRDIQCMQLNTSRSNIYMLNNSIHYHKLYINSYVQLLYGLSSKHQNILKM